MVRRHFLLLDCFGCRQPMEIPRSQKFVFQCFSLFSVRVFKVFFSQAELKLLCLFVQSLYPRHIDMPCYWIINHWRVGNRNHYIHHTNGRRRTKITTIPSRFSWILWLKFPHYLDNHGKDGAITHCRISACGGHAPPTVQTIAKHNGPGAAYENILTGYAYGRLRNTVS